MPASLFPACSPIRSSFSKASLTSKRRQAIEKGTEMSIEDGELSTAKANGEDVEVIAEKNDVANDL